MIYIKVENAVVVNRAVFGGALPPDWPQPDKWLQSDDAQIGWLYADGQLAPPPPPPDPPAPARRLVSALLIVKRLQAEGKLADARAALDAGDLYTREKWNKCDAIYGDDDDAIRLLQAIGADPAVILGP